MWSEKRRLPVRKGGAAPGNRSAADAAVAPLTAQSDEPVMSTSECDGCEGGGTSTYTPPTASSTYTPYAPTSSTVTNETSDDQEHNSGRHGQEVTFEGKCIEDSSTT